MHMSDSQFKPAWFISPHGFGHTARSCAVIEALHSLYPTLHPHIFTTAPRWFVDESIPCQYTWHETLTDIGMVQTSPLHEDVPATLVALEAFIPFDDSLLDSLADSLKKNKCTHVIADISPLSIAAAERAGIPSILIENFTWDWIYHGYSDDAPRMDEFAHIFAEYYAKADYHIQTEPFTLKHSCDLHTAPVSRPRRTPPEKTRKALGVDEKTPLILVSMGGVAQRAPFIDALRSYPHCTFMLPVHDCDKVIHQDNLILLPWHSEFHHPDLVAAANVLIGKLGYSTIAEVYNEGIAFAYFTRKKFIESPPLAKFVAREIPSVELPENVFETDDWYTRIAPLLDIPRTHREEDNGAKTIAEYLLHL